MSNEVNPTRPSPAIQWLAWGVLLLVILGIVGAFVRSRSMARAAALPVFGTIADFNLTNQLGNRTTLADLHGKIWVADIIFTRCPGPCAEMTRRMVALQKALPKDPSLQLISLTTDPDYDNPKVLQEYGKKFGADETRWWFLTGTKPEIRRLSIEGLKLSTLEKEAEQRATPDDLFVHSTTFVLVDKQGQLRAVFESVGEGIDPAQVQSQILAAVNQLLKE